MIYLTKSLYLYDNIIIFTYILFLCSIPINISFFKTFFICWNSKRTTKTETTSFFFLQMYQTVLLSSFIFTSFSLHKTRLFYATSHSSLNGIANCFSFATIFSASRVDLLFVSSLAIVNATVASFDTKIHSTLALVTAV